jgi:hypothetical protein
VRGGGVLFLVAGPEWRNWQTRRTQNPVAARPCGFDPLLRDHFSSHRAVRGLVRISCLPFPLKKRMLGRVESV